MGVFVAVLALHVREHVLCCLLGDIGKCYNDGQWVVVVVGGWLWLRVGGCGCGWLVVVVGGCLWMRVGVRGCGWVVVVVGGCLCSWVGVCARGWVVCVCNHLLIRLYK